MQVFYGLKELGCLYQVDPTSPFTAAQENPLRIDSISLPRDTLKRLTGDCDDLTVLYCALLESVGEETAFITVPGHIYAAVNTRVPSKQYQMVHQDKNMTLPIDGMLWVPVEITMIGTADFLDAWRRGIEQFAALDGNPELRQVTFTARAQEVFRPVGLRETDLGLQYGSSRRIVDQYSGCLTRLVDQILEGQTRMAQELASKEGYNRLGIVCAQYRRFPEAQKAFNTALALDRNYLSPQINLGNLLYLKQDYEGALRVYHGAEERLAAGGLEGSSLFLSVLVNISRAYYELENYEKATWYFEQAAVRDPSLAQQYAYLSKKEKGEKGALAGESGRVLFAGGEE
jgi:tetratricopeptide (TPR) repeat protein